MKRKILCSSADIECPWTGLYEEYQEHLKTCPYTALRAMLSQIIANNKQLTEQVNQQQIQIDTAKSSIPNNSSSSATNVLCDNCSDCWRGAVRGSYFRGRLGGGFQP
ncbi:unnamed protein product, partial [Rotaria sp. Silwood2]